MRLIIFFLIFSTFSCKYDNEKDVNIDSKKKPEMIYISFQGKIKDTLVVPNIKFTKYKPVITYTSNNYPYIDNVLIEDSNSKKEAIEIKNENEIIIRHKYRLEDIYYNFKKGDSVIYEDSNGFPIYHVFNSGSKHQDLEYEMKKRKYLGQKEPKGFNYFQFSKLMSANNTKKILEDYLNKLNLDFQREAKLIDSLHIEKKISRKFYEIQKQKIKFDRYNFFLSAKGNDFYLKNIKSLRKEFLNDSLVKYDFFKKFIKKASAFEAISLDRNDNQNKVINPKSIYKFLIKTDLFLTQSKNYLLYNSLKNISEETTLKDFEEAYKLFLTNVNSPLLLNDIKNKYLVDLNELKIITNEVYMVNIEKKNISLDEFININKGKLIYIDFWASWCAPCRAAMPASKRLHKDYINKDVVFLYISIDKSFEKWKKASEQENLDFFKNSLLGINYPMANFYKELNLRTIPRYLLYNKKGELIHQNAPAPDAKEVRELFDKYLEE